MPPKTNNQTLLDLIGAVKSLAITMDQLRSSLEAQGNSHERQLAALTAQVQRLDRGMAVLPMTIGDRTGNQLDRQLDEFRRALDSLRMSVWQQVGRPVGPEASGSGLTVRDGVPQAVEDEPSASVVVRHDGKVQLAGQVDAAKLWRWVKFVLAALAAATGVGALVRSLLGL